MRKLLVWLFLACLLVGLVSAASASLVSRVVDDVVFKEPYVFGLQLSGDYYVVSVLDGGFSISYNPETEVKRVIEMNYWDLGEFFVEYSFSDVVKRKSLLSSTFMIPVNRLIYMDDLVDSEVV